jgi:hypothetical protein
MYMTRIKTYISAAGNFGAQSSFCLISILYLRQTDFLWLCSIISILRDGTDVYQPTIPLSPAIYTIVLQWDNDLFILLGGLNPAPNDS